MRSNQIKTINKRRKDGAVGMESLSNLTIGGARKKKIKSMGMTRSKAKLIRYLMRL